MSANDQAVADSKAYLEKIANLESEISILSSILNETRLGMKRLEAEKQSLEDLLGDLRRRNAYLCQVANDRLVKVDRLTAELESKR